MLYSKHELDRAVAELQSEFRAWNPESLSLVRLGENHLIDGKNFLTWLRTHDPVKNIILDVLEEHALRSERIGVSSSEDVAKNVLSAKELGDVGTIKSVLAKSRYPMRGDFRNIVSERFDEKYHDLLNEIVDKSESDGNVFLRRENVVKTILEKLDGYIFELESPFRTVFDERNVKCFIVDGFVESVGEIHHLLDNLSRSNSPAILFARNFAPDVVTTIQHNKKIGKLNLLPIQVKFDFDDLNTMVDIAVISSGDLVSSDKGDLIKTIIADKAPCLDRVVYQSNKLILINSKTVRQTKNHLSSLQKRANDCSDETRRRMIERRMGSLSTNCLKVTVPSNKIHDAIESTVDKFLRIVRTCLHHGVIEFEGKIVPVSTFVSSYVFTRKFYKAISTIDCIIQG